MVQICKSSTYWYTDTIEPFSERICILFTYTVHMHYIYICSKNKLHLEMDPSLSQTQEKTRHTCNKVKER